MTNVDRKGATDTVMLNTSLGFFLQRAAEKIFLNAGGLRIAAKARTTRFKNKRSRFDDNSFQRFCQDQPCCSAAIKKYDRASLSPFKKQQGDKTSKALHGCCHCGSFLL